MNTLDLSYQTAEPQSLHQALATPFIWLPGQDKEQSKVECQKMLYRSLVLREVLNGKLNFDDYLEVLHEHGIDPLHSYEIWADGGVLL